VSNGAARRLIVGRRIFVSYSRRDFYFAEQLAVALRRRELAAWFDVHELAAGTDWSAGIDRAIVECDALVLVATRASLESPYVRRECDRLGGGSPRPPRSRRTI
jgi:TIR domain